MGWGLGFSPNAARWPWVLSDIRVFHVFSQVHLRLMLIHPH